MDSLDPTEFLHVISRIPCDIFNTFGALFESLRGTLTTSPELAQFMNEQRMHDRERMRSTLKHLFEIAPIRRGLSFEKALDIYCTMLSFESFLWLVKMRNWSLEEYESWLADALARQLLETPDMDSATPETCRQDRASTAPASGTTA